MKLFQHCVLALWALNAASPQEHHDRATELRRGFDLVDKGKTRQAIRIFEAENQAAGDNCLDCLLGLATAYSTRGSYEQAEEEARKLIERTDDRQRLISAYNLLGFALYRSTPIPQPWTSEAIAAGGPAHQTALKNLKEIEEAFRMAVELDEGRDETLRRNLMEVNGWLSMVGEASPVVAERRPAGNTPVFAGDSFEDRGGALLRQGKLDEAIEVFRDQLKYQPDSVAVNYNLALALQRSDRLDEAIAAYRRVLELEPDHGPTHNNLANTLRSQGRLEEAIEVYQRAMELQPDYAATTSNLSSAFRQQGHAAETVSAARRALELDANDATAYNNLGYGLHEQGKLEEAIEAYGSALALEPSANIYNNLGIAQRELNQLDEAIQAFLGALELDPRSVAAYNNLGGALRKQGALVQANEAYRNALELEPSNPLLYNNLAIVLRDQGAIEESVEAYIKALELWQRGQP